LGEGIRDRNDRLAEIRIGHAGGAPQPARAGHVASMGGGARAIGGHGSGLSWLRRVLSADVAAERAGGLARTVRSTFAGASVKLSMAPLQSFGHAHHRRVLAHGLYPGPDA